MKTAIVWIIFDFSSNQSYKIVTLLIIKQIKKIARNKQRQNLAEQQ